jgi:hypothetical protein
MNDGEVCAVCMEPLGAEEDSDARLPGCGHRFHVACVMTFCQYDARCPVCRGVPTGVARAAHAQHASQPTAITITVAEVVEEIETALATRRRAWQRYRARRRRALNNDPHLRTLYDTLGDARRALETETAATERLYWKRCRELWRTDPDLAAHRLVLARYRRRERRLDRTLYARLHALVGDEPE